MPSLAELLRNDPWGAPPQTPLAKTVTDVGFDPSLGFTGAVQTYLARLKQMQGGLAQDMLDTAADPNAEGIQRAANLLGGLGLKIANVPMALMPSAQELRDRGYQAGASPELQAVGGALGDMVNIPEPASVGTLLAGLGKAAVGAKGLAAAAAHGGPAVLKSMAIAPKGFAPRVFYRGTVPGATERISTGVNDWDSHLFAASNVDDAKLYGPSIETITAKPDAKILYEGTKEWVDVAGRWRKGESLLEYSNRAANAARAAGYDAAHFQRQGDVGTAIFNPDKFDRSGQGLATSLPSKSAAVAPLGKGLGSLIADATPAEQAALKARLEAEAAQTGGQASSVSREQALNGLTGSDGITSHSQSNQAAGSTPMNKFDFDPSTTAGTREAKIGDTKITYGVGKNGLVEVVLIKTPKDKRGQGSARAAMQQMVSEADALGLRLGLHADPMDKGVSKSGLEEFYKSLGFERNAGRKRDFSTRLEFLREPRK